MAAESLEDEHDINSDSTHIMLENEQMMLDESRETPQGLDSEEGDYTPAELYEINDEGSGTMSMAFVLGFLLLTFIMV